MTTFWILLLIFSTMFQPGRRWVTAQSLTDSLVFHPDKELSVNIGDSATLRCCVSENEFGMTAWFKQKDRKPPQLMIKFYKTSEEMFYNGIEKSRIKMERSSNCFNMTILNIIQSDEAMYYCAVLIAHRPVFGDGTYLNINETSKPALCDNSVVREPTLHRNNTNMNTQEKAVLGLGTALGLCALLIFCLTYFILRRRKCDKLNTFREDSPGMRQEPEAEILNYAALQFSKRKAKAEEKRKPGSSDGCVYSDVKKSVKSVRCNK
ncbi:uncharacterized protein LOC131357874 [Hemibagrus wyckioides]|uniref:uncharacterized protein LOC131357874 n=1 Tax=Hemibagrus wyckioides TaxID=337641 RepID=UPI00266BC7AA|nr:uncharacterized protein LOC131357874 [Hemibagrus wyckioides]